MSITVAIYKKKIKLYLLWHNFSLFVNFAPPYMNIFVFYLWIIYNGCVML